jgi:deoxyribose-phosphate aldolase
VAARLRATPLSPSNAFPGLVVAATPRPRIAPAARAGSRFPLPVSRVADFIDHTLLKAEATRSEIDTLCAEAKAHRFAAVCVNGVWVARCAAHLAGSGVKVAAVVGFPLGAMPSAAKACEAKQAVSDGADEIDMVAAVGHILDEDWDYVEDDIRAVVEASAGRTVKVILETAALAPLQVVKAAAIAKESGAGFVKTSTGFHPAGGATAEAVALMRLAVGDSLGVKAAGGVRDCATALRMIAAGATRLGTSSGVKLVDCLGPGPLPLADLLAAPEKHELVCRTGNCETY